VLHAAVMRARPAAVLRKRHAAVAADGFLVIGLGTAGRRVNPARSLHPRPRRAGRFATPTSDAARASREADHELTFALDQSLGADHD